MSDKKVKFVPECGGRKQYPKRIKITNNKNTKQNKTSKKK